MPTATVVMLTACQGALEVLSYTASPVRILPAGGAGPAHRQKRKRKVYSARRGRVWV